MKLLVVEDDALQRLVAVELLVEAGYDVVDAENADHAVQMIEDGWPGRVVVTDVHMPGSINGFELAQTICKRWPAIGVVILSGVLRPAAGDLPDASRFLAKPYQPAQLTCLIEEVAATHGA
ncbi:MAG: response regulator [Hyphomicrobiaceae bacterium]|nr:response regulator [Hyphomicrobiaceae bacterium]